MAAVVRETTGTEKQDKGGRERRAKMYVERF